jgi:hypothetical protein
LVLIAAQINLTAHFPQFKDGPEIGIIFGTLADFIQFNQHIIHHFFWHDRVFVVPLVIIDVISHPLCQGKTLARSLFSQEGLN